MKKNYLKKYAYLIAKSGANVQKNQEVIINASFDQIDFIRMLVKECYKLGAKDVTVLWSDPELTIYDFKYKKQKDLNTLKDWEHARWEYYVKNKPCRIYITSDDPSALSKINLKKYSASNKALMPIIRKYRDQIDGYYQWCIAGVPSAGWAKKVFPNLSKSKAIEALWDVIFKVSRIDDNDPVLNWEKHDSNLTVNCKKLNDLNLVELRYKNSLGTNLKIGLIKDVIWLGGGEKVKNSDIFFQPNIPTEEIFTSPMKGKAEGIVYASKPLSYQGNIIDKFWLKFENGKVVDFDAEVGKDVLKEMLSVDENASYLGECALIPYDSPINNTNLLFYETLYDENASCHLAVGRGFPMLMKNNENMTLEEITSKGINNSGSHVDFMIGTKDLEIIGIDDKGKKHTIFKNGNWAI
ncbi:MAG: aminopeptidase [Bacillales bacterium]